MNRNSWISDCLYHLPSTFAAVESTDGLGIHILVKYADDDGELAEWRRGCRNGENHDLKQQVSGRATYRTMFLRSFTVAKGKTEGQ